MKSQQEIDSLLTTAGATGLLAICIGIARGVIQQKHGSLGAFIRGITSSVVVAVLVGWGIHETSLSLTTQMAFVGVCAYLADDVLMGLLVIGRLFREDPGSFISRTLDLFRGKPTPPPNP